MTPMRHAGLEVPFADEDALLNEIAGFCATGKGDL